MKGSYDLKQKIFNRQDWRFFVLRGRQKRLEISISSRFFIFMLCLPYADSPLTGLFYRSIKRSLFSYNKLAKKWFRSSKFLLTIPH